MSERDVRDVQDARDLADRYFADLAQARREPSVGARPRMGQSSAAPTGNGGGGCPPRHSTDWNREGSCANGDSACDVPPECGGTILGFHSLGAANFPIAAPVAPALFVTADLQVNSGRCCTYRARKFFFQARDAVTLTVTPALFTSAVIAGEQQLASSDAINGITADVFALTCEPLPVAWRKFSNTPQQNLILSFANFGGAPTQNFFGVMWGDCTW